MVAINAAMRAPKRRKKVVYKDIVPYDEVDPYKIECGERAFLTRKNAERLGVHFLEWTYGESATAVELSLPRFGTVHKIGGLIEGVGTKNLAAPFVRHFTGKTYFNEFGIDDFAMSANDGYSLGISPIAYAQFLAVAHGSWFADKKRRQDLIAGTGAACDIAGCVWGGGETQVLQGIIVPGTELLAGSIWGIPPTGRLLNSDDIQDGDLILGLQSSGAHANGHSTLRVIAELLPDRYATKLPGGGTFGEAMLRGTHIYNCTEDLLVNGVEIHKAENITGHGWAKIMRARKPHCYHIHTLPPPQPFFEFLENCGHVKKRECYKTYNMGLGFVYFIPKHALNDFMRVLKKYEDRFKAFVIGEVRQASTRSVVIGPKKIKFTPRDLKIRK
jgi:phosphoribosylformylglycinamidine cyclo-ligase